MSGRVLGIVSVVALIGAVRPAMAATAPSYCGELVAKSRALGLAESTLWLRLGHWRSGLFHDYESEADGRPFFLADEGKGDPAAELEATLRGFFEVQSPASNVKQRFGAADQHPRCRFPARYAWLKAELGIDEARLPPVYCPKYEAFRELLAPAGLTLVFTSYYLNNPASAFGHTFLRVSKRGARAAGDGRDLLDYGIDFAATVDTSNPLIYAFKGLTGLFPGVFSKVPYYVKVREYNDFESRDIWEYELELSQEEVDRVVAHIWELGSTYFAYYYTTENCSYHVLGALEVASPRISLLSHLGWPVIPADTVKALAKNPGLIRAVHYRPSNRSAFRHRIEGLDGDEQLALAAIMNDPDGAMPGNWTRQREARVLDVALDLADFKYARDLVVNLPDRDPDGVQLQHTLLKRRADLAVASAPARFAPPFRKQPLAGHDSVRLGLGPGYAEAGGYYHAFSFRTALHDLGDPSEGYPEGASIEFLPLSLRYYVEHPQLELEDGSLVRITSLTPLSSFVRQLSWRVDVGARRDYDDGCNGCLMASGALGGGAAFEVGSEALTLFAMGEARLGAPVDTGLLEFVRVGLGPIAGLRIRATSRLTLLGQGRWSWLPAQEPWQTWQASGSVRWGYRKNMAVGAEGELEPRQKSVQLSSYLYF